MTSPAAAYPRPQTNRSASPQTLLRTGRQLESLTLAWNVVGVVIVGVAAFGARSVALVGFGLDSLVEIGASVVVLWELASVEVERRERALRLIRVAFLLLAGYLAIQSLVIVISGSRAHHSAAGVVWLALTAVVMFALATGKRRVGTALDNPVLLHEASVTVVDGLLACAVMIGLLAHATLGWWWADPAAAFVIVFYALREAGAIAKSLDAHAP